MKGQRFETNRVKLADKIPLSTPYSVTIVPCSYCNFACTFCPSRLLENKALMSLKTFAGIIDNAKFPEKVKMLHLYNVGEPTINPDLHHMIKFAKASGFSERISMVTNASLLDERVSTNIINAGIDRIIVSLYGLDDEDYLKYTNKNIDFNAVYRNIRFLNSTKGSCIVHVKIIDRVFSNQGQREMFARMFKNHCTSYSVEPVLPIWPNFRPEGECPELDKVGLYEGVPAKERLVCHYPFYSMVVNARGKVNPCLADWSESVELGDTDVEGLGEIWNGSKYAKFRIVQLIGGRIGHRLCGTCGTLRVATAEEDDLDDSREELIRRLE